MPPPTFTNKADTTYLRCSCCNTPIAEFKDGALVVIARHDGTKHETVIPLSQLDKLKGRV